MVQVVSLYTYVINSLFETNLVSHPQVGTIEYKYDFQVTEALQTGVKFMK